MTIQQDIQILRTDDGDFYVRPLTDRARKWVAEYLHPESWEFNAAGWLILRGHVERTTNDASVAGLVRAFIAEFKPINLGYTPNSAAGAAK